MMCQAVEAYIYSKKGVAIKINRIALSVMLGRWRC